MSIQVIFERIGANVGKYFVSIGGFPPCEKGEGANGRAEALGVLAFIGLSDSSKNLWIKSLKNLENACVLRAYQSITIDAGQIVFAAISDETIIYRGKDIDEQYIATTRIEVTKIGHQEPGI